MKVIRVELYDVNGYKVCATERKELEKYLMDVPSEMIQNIDYEGKVYVNALGREFQKEGCKELQHMKINKLFLTEEEAQRKVS